MSASGPQSISETASHNHFDHRQLRDAFSRFGTGVTIVTAASTDGPRAITVNSFSSVSLEPPLVLWSIDQKSVNFEPFVTAIDYSIHVLSVEQDTLCRDVSRNPQHLRDVDLQTNDYGVPVLSDCLARYDCAREALYEAGDHVIVVGQVRQVSIFDDLDPLIFYRGRTGAFALTGIDPA